MQAVIKKFFVNDITTKYGQKKKYDVYIDTANGEWKFSAWQGLWNQDWNQNVTINIPDMGDQRWKKSQYNGNEQFTLAAPPKDGYAQPASTAPIQPPAPAPVSPNMTQTAPAIPVIQVEETPITSDNLQIEEILKIVNEIKVLVSKNDQPLLDPTVQASVGANPDDVDVSDVKF